MEDFCQQDSRIVTAYPLIVPFYEKCGFQEYYRVKISSPADAILQSMQQM